MAEHKKSPNDKPNDNPLNVLFIAVDDLRPQMGCYGDPDAITPHMDSLADEGMVFQRAYCQQAVCGPSRASLMTGLRPDSIRVWDLQTHFRTHRPDAVTLSQHFKNHGYHAECIGKIYHDPRSHRDKPSWSVDEMLDVTSEVGGKYVREENLALYDPESGHNKAAAAECADVPDDAYIDGRVANKAMERLRALDGQDEPFFCAVGFRRPHLPFSAPTKYWEMQDPDRIGTIEHPLPPEDVPKMALHEWDELRGYTDIPELGDLTPEQKVHLRHGYYAAMSYTDAQIGKVIDELERLGLRENTVICLWGDHGWHLGEHGLWGKTTNFELDTNAPLIISVPGQPTAGESTDSLVEFVDIYPTLADVCDLPVPDGLEGMSLTPVLADPSTTVKDHALSQFPRPWRGGEEAPIMGYTVRTDRYRYTEWRRWREGGIAARELYDHEEDPGETVNLAVRDEYTDQMEELSTLLSPGRAGFA